MKLENCHNHAGLFETIPSYFDNSLSYMEEIAHLKHIVNDIIKFANNELSNQLKEYIVEQFNNIFIETAYDKETETLIMRLEKENVE